MLFIKHEIFYHFCYAHICKIKCLIYVYMATRMTKRMPFIYTFISSKKKVYLIPKYI